MEKAFQTSEAFRQDFILTAQNFIIGIVLFVYCQHKNAVQPGFTDFRHRLMAISFLTLLGLPAITFKELMAAIHTHLDRVVFMKIDMELRLLHENTLHHVMNISQRLECFLKEIEHVRPSSLYRVSVIGRYLRKMSLTLNVADFRSLAQFSRYLKCYLDGAMENESREESSIQRLSITLQDVSIASDVSEDVKPTPRGAVSRAWGKTRAHAFVNAHAIRFKNSEAKLEKAEKLQRDLEAIVEEDPDFTDAQYITFLNQLLFGEYRGSIESCHNFFLATKRNSAVKFRFALLNLAIVYRKFHHLEQAELALSECINLCQLTYHTKALKVAFRWLESIRPVPNELSSGKPSEEPEASHALYFTRYLNHLEYLPLTEETPRQSLERLNRRWAGRELEPGSRIARNVEEALLWKRYGFHQYARVHFEMVICLSRIRVSPTSGERNVVMNESTLFAIATEARWAMANYNEVDCFKQLEIALSMIPARCEMSDMIDFETHSLCCEKALRRESYENFKHFVDRLSLISPSIAHVYRARKSFQMGDCDTALRILEKCDSQPGDGLLRVVRGLYRTRILNDVGSDQVVGCILKYLAECERYHLGYLSAMFKLELVRYQSRIGRPLDATVPVIRFVGPMILSQGPYEDRLYYQKVMGELTQNVRVQIERMTLVYEEWRLRRDAYNQRCALDFLARKCHEVGLIESRDVFAQLFRKLVTTPQW